MPGSSSIDRRNSKRAATLVKDDTGRIKRMALAAGKSNEDKEDSSDIEVLSDEDSPSTSAPQQAASALQSPSTMILQPVAVRPQSHNDIPSGSARQRGNTAQQNAIFGNLFGMSDQSNYSSQMVAPQYSSPHQLATLATNQALTMQQPNTTGNLWSSSGNGTIYPLQQISAIGQPNLMQQTFGALSPNDIFALSMMAQSPNQWNSFGGFFGMQPQQWAVPQQSVANYSIPSSIVASQAPAHFKTMDNDDEHRKEEERARRKEKMEQKRLRRKKEKEETEKWKQKATQLEEENKRLRDCLSSVQLPQSVTLSHAASQLSNVSQPAELQQHVTPSIEPSRSESEESQPAQVLALLPQPVDDAGAAAVNDVQQNPDASYQCDNVVGSSEVTSSSIRDQSPSPMIEPLTIQEMIKMRMRAPTVHENAPMGLDQDSLREVIKRIASTFSQDKMFPMLTTLTQVSQQTRNVVFFEKNRHYFLHARTPVRHLLISRMGQGYVIHAAMTIRPNRAIIRSFGDNFGGIINDSRKILFDYNNTNIRAGIPVQQLRSALDEKYHSQIMVRLSNQPYDRTENTMSSTVLERMYEFLKQFFTLYMPHTVQLDGIDITDEFATNFGNILKKYKVPVTRMLFNDVDIYRSRRGGIFTCCTDAFLNLVSKAARIFGIPSKFVDDDFICNFLENRDSNEYNEIDFKFLECGDDIRELSLRNFNKMNKFSCFNFSASLLNIMSAAEMYLTTNPRREENGNWYLRLANTEEEVNDMVSAPRQGWQSEKEFRSADDVVFNYNGPNNRRIRFAIDYKPEGYYKAYVFLY